MQLLCDKEIRQLAHEKGIISPFISELVSDSDPLEKTMISYGITPAGYDVRVENEFKLFQHNGDIIVDPLKFDHDCYLNVKADHIIVPPGGFVLCSTVERFKLPDYIAILCVGKSTYARCGIIVNTTVVEPGFEGTVVIELSNTSSCPVKIRAGNNGIAKFLFYRINPCENAYNGKYQRQSGIVLP